GVAAAAIPESYLPPEATLRLDAVSVIACALVSVSRGSVCAITPAFAASDTRVVTWLNSEGKGIIGESRPRLTEAFVVMQIVLSVCLIASHIAVSQSAAALASTALGLDPSNVGSLRVQLPKSKYPSVAARHLF